MGKTTHGTREVNAVALNYATAAGTLDGSGAGDRDQPYVFGRRARSDALGPFTTRQYLRLLVLRSRVEAGLFGTDDLHTAVENTSYTTGALS